MRRPRPAGLTRGARGSALLPVVAVLSLLSLAAAMSLLAAEADLLVAVRAVRERAAALAAEGALATALEEIAAPGAVAADAFLAQRPPAVVSTRTWRDGPWGCRSVARSIPDAADADADPATGLVLFDRSFGYEGAPGETGGFPVFQVAVTVEDGQSAGAAVAEVTPVSCLPEIAAAWTSSGALDLAGAVLVSGAAGEGEDAASVPAILARGPVLVDGVVVVEGGAGAIVTDPALAQPAGPLELLRAGSTLPSLAALPEPPGAGRLAGVAWSRGDWTGAVEGSGILVVHNPDFDPVRHEASRLLLEEGLVTEEWDPAYSHLDPSRRPAELRTAPGGEFRGLVVADVVSPPGAAASVTGALVTLSRSPQRIEAGAALTVRHSRPALAGCGRGALRHVTAWRVLPAGSTP